MFWRASGPSLDRRNMRTATLRPALRPAERVASDVLHESVTEEDGEVDAGDCLFWLGFRLVEYV